MTNVGEIKTNCLHDSPDHHMGEYINEFVKSEKLPISVDFLFAVYK